jgi:hypothetical protein
LQQQPHIRTVIVIAVIYPVADNAFFGLLAWVVTIGAGDRKKDLKLFDLN